MVSDKIITIYVEGGSPAQTGLGPDPAFRKAFNKLFSQAEGVRVKIVMIGPVGNAPKKLAEITKQNSPDVVLVDLDGPKNEKKKRIEVYYKGLATDQLFFMVQMMEAWILSQPEAVRQYAKENGYVERKATKCVDICNEIKKQCPEDISKPDEMLKRALRRCFEKVDAKGKKRLEYRKGKTAPDLIMRLELDKLRLAFEDVDALVEYLTSI